MKKYKTTKKDFKIFKSECKKWIKKFGLKDWDITYKHEKIESLGTTKWHIIDRWVDITLSKDFGKTESSKYEVKQTAYHEVIELLLAEFNTLAESRYSTYNQLETARHAIVQRMINCQFNGKKNER